MKPAARDHGDTHRPIPLAEHERVRLRKSLPEHNLSAGVKGTIVHIYRGGMGLEVEFGAGGKSPKVVALDGGDVESITD